jgi:hypothetical protein
MLEFDFVKWQDEYMQLLNIYFKPDSTFASVLKETARQLIKECTAIYHVTTADLLKAGKVYALTAKTHSNPQMFNAVSQELLATKDERKKAELEALLSEILGGFTEKTNEYNAILAKLIKNVEDASAVLHKNLRQDLSELGFQTQFKKYCANCVRNIGNFTQYIQTCFVEPIKAIQSEIKELDEKIESKTDPQNIIKNFKAFLPSEKEVGEMIEKGSKSEASAKMEGIKLLYSTAIKAIDVIGGVISLCEDIDKRARLYKQLNELKAGYDEALAKRQILLDEYDEAISLTVLNKLMEFFAGGADRISAYVKDILGRLDGFTAARDMNGYHIAVTAFMADIEAIYF